MIWAGNFVISRGVHELAPPVSLAFWRWLVALLIVLPLMARPLILQRELIFRHWKLMALLAFFGVTLFNTFVYFATQSTTAINTTLIASTSPVFIVLLARWFGGEGLSLRRFLGILICLLGVVLVVSRANPSILLELQFNKGDAWALAAAIIWAVYSVLLKQKPEEMRQRTMLAATIILGWIMLLPWYLWESGYAMPTVFNEQTVSAILYLGIFASVVAFLVWNYSVRELGAGVTGLYLYFTPLIAYLFSVLFLGESFHLYHLAGLALIFSGVWLSTRKGKASG